MENNVKFSVSSSYFMFVLWFIYSRLNGVSEALVRCVRVAKRKTHQKLHNFGDIIFFFVAPSHCHFTISIFEQWAKSSRSPILWISNGCESCSVWGFSSHLMLTINRLAIIQMRVNCRSNQILIYIKWHSNAVINETKKFFMFFQLRQTAGDCFPLLN